MERGRVIFALAHSEAALECTVGSARSVRLCEKNKSRIELSRVCLPFVRYATPTCTCLFSFVGMSNVTFRFLGLCIIRSKAKGDVGHALERKKESAVEPAAFYR